MEQHADGRGFSTGTARCLLAERDRRRQKTKQNKNSQISKIPFEELPDTCEANMMRA